MKQSNAHQLRIAIYDYREENGWSGPSDGTRYEMGTRWGPEVGPPTPTPPQTLNIEHTMLQPSGGLIPESTANAEKNKTVTEGDEALVSEFTILVSLV